MQFGYKLHTTTVGILKNRKLEIMAHALVRGLGTYDAAREAGFNPDVPSFEANARKRATRPDVRARVKELQERVANKVVCDLAWVTQRLVEIAGIPLGGMEIKTADTLKAMDMLIKVRGYYAPEKREIIQRLSELSVEELKALNERLSATEQQPEEQESTH
jgi:hypothetical protein